MYSVERLSREEWVNGRSMRAHALSFGEYRSSALERIDFALIVSAREVPRGYVQCIEMDSETVYWQIGGAFAGEHGSHVIVPCYLAMIDWCLERYKRITTRIENTNIRMLHLAMKVGFLVVGTWNFQGKIYLELLNEKAVANGEC